MSVGANIKAKRTALNLTQRELAQRVNVDPSMICQIERGTKMPTLPLGKEIADALQAQHGIAIPKTKIVQDEPIKAFGGYELKVKLGYEVTGTLKVVVAEA